MGLIAPESPLLYDIGYANLSVEQQAQIDALINVATTRIQRFCNRIFEAADYLEYHNGSGGAQIFVNNPPINSLTSIGFITSETTTVDGDQFTYHSKQGQIKWLNQSLEAAAVEFLGYFFQGDNNILISYNGGWSEIPWDIQEVCAEAVKEMFDPSLASGGMQKEKLGQYFYDRGSGAITRALMPHRKVMSEYKIRDWNFEDTQLVSDL